MAADFKLVKSYTGGMPTIDVPKASATVIEAGDMIELASGLAIKATATGAKIAYAPYGAIAGELVVKVLDDRNAIFQGTGDANFAVAQRGTEVDLVVNTNAQQIDVGASATDVFVVDVSGDAGVVGAATNIRVRINKPIY